MRRNFISLIAAALLLCSLALTAFAHDVPQAREDCSIEVAVRYDGENVTGGTLTAIKVGYVDEENGNYFFSREYDHVKLEDIQSADAVDGLKEFYETNKNNYDFYAKTVSVADGKGLFTDLPTGLYLIIQEKAAAGYSRMNPFLVGVPYLEDGVYQYHVTAAMKPELEREPETTAPPPTKPDDKLPQTGQLNWPVPLLAAAGIGLFAMGWALRRKENDEA